MLISSMDSSFITEDNEDAAFIFLSCVPGTKHLGLELLLPSVLLSLSFQKSRIEILSFPLYLR